MGIADSMKKAAFSTAFSYIGKNPEENAPKLMAWVDKFAGDGPNSFPTQRAAVRKVINDKDNNMHHLVMDIMKDTDPEVLKATFMNFFLNANIIGWPKQEENRKKYNCNIPWAILLDPTSACNLHCTGCWAAEYGNRLNLTFDEIDSIITQGKELGVYMYIYTGGEPLVRKKDLIAICNKHSDCQFLSFTNGTLIDEEFADEMLRVKNFIPAISLEGFEAATDGRRGNGVFEKVTRAMKLLHDKHLPFGISACYTSANIDSIASDEYIDYMLQPGRALHLVFPLHAGRQRRRPAAPAESAAARIHVPPHPRNPRDKADLRDGLPERRRVCRRLYRRRPPLPAHQRQRRRRSVRVHPLLQREHPQLHAARSAAKPDLHGLS